MASPVTGDSNLPSIPNDFKSPNLTVSHSQPHAAPSLSKRRKSKPARFETDAQKQLPLSIVAIDPSSRCLSLQKEKSPTKAVKTPVPSSSAMIRAVNFQSSLESEFPSCIKMMVKSQVTSGFWMGLPLHFCKNFLPKDDAAIVLEDENGDQCEVKYIAYKFGLSAGWKTFVFGHHLTEGDVLIFRLVETTKFKIYIFKANDPNEVNGPLRLLNLEAHTEEMTPTPVTPSPKTNKKKHSESLSLTVVNKKHKKSTPSSKSIPVSQLNGQLIEHSGNDSEEVGSEVLESSRPSKTNISFEEIKTVKDFHIMVKGKCIDRELPDDVRTGYYKLCFYKKQFLHKGIPESLYCKLVAGMIGETVSIANEIKNCMVTTSKEKFETWDKILKSFELLGMKVGFLRDRIDKLVTIVFESEGALDIKRYVEAMNKQKRAEDEIKKVAAKLKELKGSVMKYECVSGCLKQKADKYENKFKEELDAPW